LFSAKEIIALAIRIETNGEATYRKAARLVRHPEIEAKLVWMADQEEAHAKWFRNLKVDFVEIEANILKDEFNRMMLDRIVGRRSFTLEGLDFTQIDQVNELLTMFIEFERDTALFYELIGAFVESESTQKHLSMIIDEEQRHVEILQDIAITA
jgi:rubrerythrin